jgi:hypothetical protein
MVGKLAITATLLSGIVLGANGAAAASGNPFLGLVEYGVLGICVIGLTIALVRKDRQVNALYTRLIEKAEKDSVKYHELAEALNDTLQELVDAVEVK